MRFFQKSRAVVDVDEQVTESIEHVDQNDVDKYYEFKGHSFEKHAFPPYTFEESVNVNSRIGKCIDNENGYPKNKQSIGELVRKLNCSASKKHDCDFNQHLTDGSKSGHWNNTSFTKNQRVVSPPFRRDTSSETTRPVLITVNTGEVNGPFDLCDENSKNLSNRIELNRTFIVGDLPKSLKMGSSSSFRLGMTARKRHHDASKYFKNLSTKDKVRSQSCGVWQNNYARNHQDIDARRTAQEVARRERWKRGLEMEKRMFKNATTTTGRERDDTSSNDSLTMGSHTTGTSVTGYDTTEDSSSLDDWTDATDESNLTPKYHHHYRHTSSGGHCSSSQRIVESVAEDFGIFANLLLSDGYACFGTAAEITKETVGGCRSDNVSRSRMN